MNTIRIKRIQVRNLFENINYDMDLTRNDSLAIITAPNGRGKTTILNMVAFIFSPSYDRFTAISKVPFESFRCILSNGKTVEFKKRKIVGPALADALKDHSGKNPIRGNESNYFRFSDFELCVYDEDLSEALRLVYSELYEYSYRVDPIEFLDKNEMYEFYSEGRTHEINLKYVWKRQLESLQENDCGIPVHYIAADRIYPIEISIRKKGEVSEVKKLKSPLEEAKKEIRGLVRDSIEKYNEAVSQAKDRLPQMFLEEEGTDLICEQFLIGWKEYRDKLKRLQDIGVIVSSNNDFTEGKDIASVYEQKGPFLSAYLSAFKDTTAPFEDIYYKLRLFKDIFDERNVVTGKKVTFPQGRVLITFDYTKIPKRIDLDALSSGEKHDFMMFYELIFKTGQGELVLIDEPEISLHIEWQETYLDRLLEICQMNGLQAVIATHSPYIVSGHYDCLVDKGENYGE